MKKLTIISVLALSVLLAGCTKKDNSKYQAVADSIETIGISEYEQILNNNSGNILVVNFFATWCPPCRLEMPDIVNAYNKNKDNGLAIIAVSTDNNMIDIAKFMDEFDIEFPVYLADEALQRKHSIQKIPTTLIYEPNGDLFHTANGMIDEAFINRLMSLKVK